MFSDSYSRLIIVTTIFICVAKKTKLGYGLLSYAILSIPTVFILVDWAVYRGDMNGQYLTNTAVAVFLSIFFLFYLICEKSAVSGRKLLLLTSILIIAIPARAEFNITSQRTNHHVSMTRQFQFQITDLVKFATEHPSSQFIFVAQSGWDYESAFSTAKFLRYRGFNGQMFLKVVESPESTIFDMTLEKLSEISLTGSIIEQYEPLRNLKPSKGSICLYSEKIVEAKEPICDKSVILKWL